MLTDHRMIWVVFFEALGIGSIIGGIAPVARSDLPIRWIILLPIGIFSIVLAVRLLGTLNGERSQDLSTRRAVLRLAIYCTMGGVLSSWLALAVYRPVVLQFAGVLAGACLLFTATVLFGGWYEPSPSRR